MAAEVDTPMLSPAIREKILAYIPRYPSKRAVTLPALAHRPRVFPLRPLPGDGRDRRDPRDHRRRSPRHDELLRVLPAGPHRRRPGLDLPVVLVHDHRRRRDARARLPEAGRPLGPDDPRRQADRRVRRMPGDLRLRPGRPRRRRPDLRPADPREGRRHARRAEERPGRPLARPGPVERGGDAVPRSEA